jgi:hypothetical protein
MPPGRLGDGWMAAAAGFRAQFNWLLYLLLRRKSPSFVTDFVKVFGNWLAVNVFK